MRDLSSLTRDWTHIPYFERWGKFLKCVSYCEFSQKRLSTTYILPNIFLLWFHNACLQEFYNPCFARVNMKVVPISQSTPHNRWEAGWGGGANEPVEGNCWPQSWVAPLSIQKCPSDDNPAPHLLNFTHQRLIKTLRPVSSVIVWINAACLEPNLSCIFLVHICR